MESISTRMDGHLTCPHCDGDIPIHVKTGKDKLHIIIKPPPLEQPLGKPVDYVHSPTEFHLESSLVKKTNSLNFNKNN
jgi:hypothetical protein